MMKIDIYQLVLTRNEYSVLPNMIPKLKFRENSASMISLYE